MDKVKQLLFFPKVTVFHREAPQRVESREERPSPASFEEEIRTHWSPMNDMTFLDMSIEMLILQSRNAARSV